MSQTTLSAGDVREQFDLDYELDYDFVSKEEFTRVKWREKNTRGRWHKLCVFKSEAHPSLGDLIEHRAEYVAAWLNMRAEENAHGATLAWLA